MFPQAVGGHQLLSFEQEKALTAIVKDYLFLENLKQELTDILHREPTLEEWAQACNTDAMYVLFCVWLRERYIQINKNMCQI